MLTINELSKRTGLSVDYIRSCQKQMGDILTPYIHQGSMNQCWFDRRGVVIFEKIKQLKDQGLSLPDIAVGFQKEIKEAVIDEYRKMANRIRYR